MKTEWVVRLVGLVAGVLAAAPLTPWTGRVLYPSLLPFAGVTIAITFVALGGWLRPARTHSMAWGVAVLVFGFPTAIWALGMPVTIAILRMGDPNGMGTVMTRMDEASLAGLALAAMASAAVVAWAVHICTGTFRWKGALLAGVTAGMLMIILPIVVTGLGGSSKAALDVGLFVWLGAIGVQMAEGLGSVESAGALQQVRGGVSNCLENQGAK